MSYGHRLAPTESTDGTSHFGRFQSTKRPEHPKNLSDASAFYDIAGLVRQMPITRPALVVNGDKDPVVPDGEAKYIADAVHGRLMILRGENHASYMLKIKWAGGLKGFLNACTRRAR
ncbi:MAG: hypothetical protein U0L49_03275 [Eubacterium sp.]|nr:hypothetical protein [Eubacterium sp.]